MSHPIQVEKTFRELMLELEQTTSVRQRFTLIRRFILSLNGEYKKYDSYLFSWLKRFPFIHVPHPTVGSIRLYLSRISGFSWM
jgi:hypothetical protein